MSDDPFRSTDFSLPLQKRIDAYFRSVTTSSEYHGFETFPLQQVRLLNYSTSTSQIFYTARVPVELCNKDGNMHGGAVTTLLDNLSSTALYTISKPGYWDSLGVSRSLYTIFHRGIPVDSKVRITCTVVAAGRRMVTLRAEILTEDGKLCATCIHEKVYTPPPSKL